MCGRRITFFTTPYLYHHPRTNLICLFFFFQAEDGIRDTSVTGVQTCALPILRGRTLEQLPMAKREQPSFVGLVPNQFPKPVSPDTFGLAAFDALYSMAPYYIGPDEALVMTGRSEERRVGKEGRSRGGTAR